MRKNSETVTATTTEIEPRLSRRNFWAFALGAFGRDFSYNFFTGYLLSFIIFTKTLTEIQFTCVSVIIIAARIFDAFNDPFMGGVIESTRTKWGKFRPWIYIGALTTGVVISLIFAVPLDGWGFIGFLAVMYFLFSVTFTMNDIAYWGMLPALGKRDHDRNSLTSVTSIIGSLGTASVGFIVPALTTTYSRFLGGSAQSAYMWTAIIAAVLMILSQTITVFFIKEDPLPALAVGQAKPKRMTLKDMFRVIKNNDQLLCSALVLTFYSIGTGVVTGGLSTTYIYFEFGYNGLLTTLFAVIAAVLGTLVVLTFPYFVQKTGRNKVILFGAICTIVGYALMMVFGVAIPTGEPIAEFLGIPIYVKFIFIMIANGLCGMGQNCFYMLMFINMANTVEYNEWKTGKREESLIFSLRPMSAKLSSALVQFFVTLIYLVVGVLGVTNGISALDKQAATGEITNEAMLEQVGALLNDVPASKTKALIACMCVLPIVFMIAAIIIYRKYFKLDEATHASMKSDIRKRKQAAALASLILHNAEAIKDSQADGASQEVADYEGTEQLEEVTSTTDEATVDDDTPQDDRE